MNSTTHDSKTGITTIKESNVKVPADLKTEMLLNALTKISELKEDKKLRSWRGREAVRIAIEALKNV